MHVLYRHAQTKCTHLCSDCAKIITRTTHIHILTYMYMYMENSIPGKGQGMCMYMYAEHVNHLSLPLFPSPATHMPCPPAQHGRDYGGEPHKEEERRSCFTLIRLWARPMSEEATASYSGGPHSKKILAKGSILHNVLGEGYRQGLCYRPDDGGGGTNRCKGLHNIQIRLTHK